MKKITEKILKFLRKEKVNNVIEKIFIIPAVILTIILFPFYCIFYLFPINIYNFLTGANKPKKLLGKINHDFWINLKIFNNDSVRVCVQEEKNREIDLEIDIVKNGKGSSSVIDGEYISFQGKPQRDILILKLLNAECFLQKRRADIFFQKRADALRVYQEKDNFIAEFADNDKKIILKFDKATIDEFSPRENN